MGEQGDACERYWRAVFVAVLLLIAGTLNIIYGIGAAGNAHFFANTQFVFSSLHTWGWITIIVGIIQLTAGFSLFGGGGYGRTIGIFAASVGALESLLSIGGTHSWWSLAMLLVRLHPARSHHVRRGEPAQA